MEKEERKDNWKEAQSSRLSSLSRFQAFRWWRRTFLESSVNVSGLKLNFQQSKENKGWVLANKPVHFVQLTDIFILSSGKLLKPLNINNNSFQVAFRARYSLGLSRNGPQNPDCDQIMSARTSTNSSFVMSCSCDYSLHDTKIKLKLKAVTQTLLICLNLKYRKTFTQSLLFFGRNKNTDYSWNYPCSAISRQHFQTSIP